MILKRGVLFSFMFMIIFTGSSFAAPGIKITKPANGSVVTPGQEISVSIKAVDGFIVKQGMANISRSPLNVKITSLPLTFIDKIPMKAIGEVSVDVIARDASGNMAVDSVKLKVQQTAILQSLTIYTDELLFETDWDGNVKSDYDHSIIGGVFGRYSDGEERYLGDDPNTTYASSDPSVISIDGKGKVELHKVGKAKITISNSGVSLDIPIVFKEPSGIRPSETIPPTAQIDIQPPANLAGWHNKDITITITAQDNENGSGVQEIDYEFAYIRGMSEDVKGSQVVIPFSEEGINLFRYVVYDNERNSSGQQSTEISIDKTPPVISLSIDPYVIKLPFRTGNSYFLMPFFYKMSCSATDKFSGVKDVKGGLSIPDIKGFRTQLIRGRKMQVILNEKIRRVIVVAPNPSEVLNQMKANNILTIPNNQVMYLNERPKLSIWTITDADKFLIISAPSITFKAEAKDNADNISMKEVKYTKKRIPLPNYAKALINRKMISREEAEDLKEDAVIDEDILRLMKNRYGDGSGR